MSAQSFTDLKHHVEHDVHVAKYVSFTEDGEEYIHNIAIECETCYTVLLDYNNPELD